MICWIIFSEKGLVSKESGGESCNCPRNWLDSSNGPLIKDVAKSWVCWTLLIKLRGTSFTETSVDVWMEEGGDILVVSSNFHTITDIYIAISIFLSIGEEWWQNRSTIFRDTECRSIWNCSPSIPLHNHGIFSDSSSSHLIACFVSNTGWGTVIMEDTVNLRMSETPISLLNSIVWVSYWLVCSRIEWINRFSWNCTEYEDTTGCHTKCSILGLTLVKNESSTSRNIRIFRHHNVTNIFVQISLLHHIG